MCCPFRYRTLVTGTTFNSSVGSTWLGLAPTQIIIRQNTFSEMEPYYYDFI
jgi:hypothetical protein